MRKILLFFLILLGLFIFKATEVNAGPENPCAVTTNPTVLEEGIPLQSITFENFDKNEVTYYATLQSPATGKCPQNPLSINKESIRDGCVSNQISSSSEIITFNQTDLGKLKNLKAGTYTLRLCTQNLIGPGCVSVCKNEGVTVLTSGGGPLPTLPPGPGEEQDCRIEPGSEEWKACSADSSKRYKGSCADSFYCTNFTELCISGKCWSCPEGEDCYKDSKGLGPTNAPLSKPCSDEDSTEEKGCVRIKTAFGFVSTNSAGFTRWLLGFVLSISGGIVLIIIIVSGYRLMTSSGDPEKVKNARDQLAAAIVGLLFIIFSLVILELITKDVLGLPGFGG
ncbi:MAG: hypothetical protein HY426_02720 [Candidatus Levybacteria bacterium]|nr:hypothetical protein [Candidatus Levybacteria bacterium]